MGLKESIQNWRLRRAQRQVGRFFDATAPAMHRAVTSRWEFFISGLTPDISEFLGLKWRLTADWDAGEGPPRPRSVEEMQATLRTDADHVRKLDWALVDYARDVHRRYDPVLPRFLAVPIDAAQECWNQEWAWLYNPDGSRKPKEEWGESSGAARQREQMQQVHQIEDEEELRLHLVRDHGHEYVKPGGPSYSFNHKKAHVDEAEDSEWDRRFRGLDSSPLPNSP